MSISQNQDHIRRLLDELEAGGDPSQRALASRLGISLGQANQLLKSLMARSWVRGIPRGGHRLRYLITSEGAMAHARMSREHLRSALISYGTLRDRVRARLEACTPSPGGSGADRPSVALYGIGEAAQIAFACAAELGVPLVGFVDDTPRDSFLGLPVRASSHLTSMALAGRSFDWLLVASLADHEIIRGRLEALGFPLERVSWL